MRRRTDESFFDEVTFLMESVERLNNQSLFSSSVLLCEPLLSRIKRLTSLNKCTSDVKWKALLLYGNALMGRGEMRRAQDAYKLSLREMPTQLTGDVNDVPGENKPPLNIIENSLRTDHAKLRFRGAKCLVASGMTTEAIAEIGCIPEGDRTPEIDVFYGKLVEKSGNPKQAVPIYTHALSHEPMAIEVVLSLIRIGISEKRIFAIFDVNKESSGQPVRVRVPWLNYWVKAQISFIRGDSKRAISYWSNMQKDYADLTSLQSLLGIGRAYLELGQWEQAENMYLQAHNSNLLNVDGMDYYAQVLYNQATVTSSELSYLARKPVDLKSAQKGRSLNALVQHLMEIAPDRPETWQSAAYYAAFQLDSDKEMLFFHRAITLDDRYSPAYLLRGSKLLSSGSFSQAQNAFTMANAFCKDIESYAGLLDTCLAQNKISEAKEYVAQAKRYLPNRPGPFLLEGKLCAHIHQPPEKIEKIYRTALELDPTHVGASLALAEYLSQVKKHDECLEVLKKTYENQSKAQDSDVLSARMGDACLKAKKFKEALRFYHIATMEKSDSEAAKKGLKRLSMILKGHDFDFSRLETVDFDSDEEIKAHGSQSQVESYRDTFRRLDYGDDVEESESDEFHFS